MSDEEVYNLMGKNEIIDKDFLHLDHGHAVYVAIDSRNRVVAVGNFIGPRNTEFKAIARGCVYPSVLEGFRLSEEFRENHNLLLSKSLEKRAKQDLERKTRESS